MLGTTKLPITDAAGSLPSKLRGHAVETPAGRTSDSGIPFCAKTVICPPAKRMNPIASASLVFGSTGIPVGQKFITSPPLESYPASMWSVGAEGATVSALEVACVVGL